jgi:CubicO group peptidase (beta-lactamase class C family)
MKKLFLFTVLSAAHSLLAQSLELKLKQVDSVFSSWNSNEAPGGVVAVVDKGQVIYKKAFGMADISKKKLNTTDTQFELASIAKQFTAMCIALLEEQDNISREEDIRKFFPEFNFGETVRVKNLLDHTSGIREGYVLALLAGKVNLQGEIPKKKNTEEFILEMLSRERDLNFTPGSEMVYTNVNFILLGEIVERVSKQSLREFADSAIFKPLGMRNTSFRDEPGMRGQNESRSYLAKKKRFKATDKLGGIVGDHNLFTTVDDMVLWVNNFRNNTLGKKDQSLIRKISASSFLNNGDSTKYGYGLFVWRDRGVLKVGHGGDDGGHTSIVTTYPEHDLAVITLANSSRYNDTESKSNTVGEIMLKGFFPNKKLVSEDKFIEVPLADLEKKAGIYWRIHPKGYGQLRRLHVKEGGLYMSGYFKGEGLQISPVTAEYFKLTKPAVWGNAHAYFKDSAGVTFLRQAYRDEPMEDFRPVEKNLTFHYKDFKGAFWNESTRATIKIKAKKGKIVARKGIIRIPLTPFKDDLFFGYEHEALFIFNRNAEGKVDRLKINARDFRNFKMVKK